MSARPLDVPDAKMVATTVVVDDPPKLIDAAGDDGWLFATGDVGIAGRGEALRIDLPGGIADPAGRAAVTAALASIESIDPMRLPGCGPIAIGALAFDPEEPGHLVVPAEIFGSDGSVSWKTTVTPSVEAPRVLRPGPSPERFDLAPTMAHSEWTELVAETVRQIDAGAFAKVVLARCIEIEADRPFVVSELLERLASLYPSCTVFKVDDFLGASPELLIRRYGAEVESHPLAGTVARSGNTTGDEALIRALMAAPKTRREHRVVVEAIAGSLAPVCESLDVPETPSVMSLRNVSHLATRITGRLSPQAPGVLELVARIHPTPAVGGSPTDAAIRYLQKVEGFERGRYAGPVGWLDSRGDGCFVLGIRSAEVVANRARIFAGNGIVAGSDPASELTETQLKLQALLAALVRP